MSAHITVIIRCDSSQGNACCYNEIPGPPGATIRDARRSIAHYDGWGVVRYAGKMHDLCPNCMEEYRESHDGRTKNRAKKKS